MFTEKLKPVLSRINDDETLYRLSDIKAAVAEVHLLGQHNAYLAIKSDDNWVEFALFEFAQSDYEETLVQPIWQGTGPSEGLRELRHSWFGETSGDMRGYVHYLSMDLMEEAFKILRKYFD